MTGAGRWRRGEGTIEDLPFELVALARRVVERLGRGRTMRWRSLGRLTDPGQDHQDAVAAVEALVSAGLVEVGEAPNPKGDFVPHSVRLVPGQETRAQELVGPPRGESSPGRKERARLLVAALERLSATREALPIPARALVLAALGDTKAVRITDFRAEIEAAFDLPLETLVRDHTAAVLTAGPARYVFRGHKVDLRASYPWTAVTEPVAAELDDLRVDADEVLTIENLAPFEALIHDGAADKAIIVFTSGFLGRAERRWLVRLAAHRAIRRVRHWGDLDPGGLYIYRSLRDLLRSSELDVRVEPWRMTADLLDHPSARPLTERDRLRLESYLSDRANPLLDLARSLADKDRKLEQEALLLPPFDLG